MEALERQVERWNRDHPVGALVKYYGTVITKTTTAAFVDSGEAKVYLEDWRLPVPLEFCTPC
jgi:hypothetical protein